MMRKNFDVIPHYILAKIIAFAADDAAQQTPRSEGSGSLHRLFTLALVCRDWHETIINWPSLWSTLSFKEIRSVEALMQCLKLSQTAPLDIRYSGTYVDLGEVDILRPEVISELPRWRSLDALICASEEVLYQLDRPAPRLECAKIHNETYSSPSIARLNLFNGDAPMLRSLDLFDIGIPSNPGSFPNLRTLKLYFRFISHPEGPVSPVMVHTLLQTFSRLEVLEFAVTWMESESKPPVDQLLPMLSMPYLRTLRLQTCRCQRNKVFFPILKSVSAPNCTSFYGYAGAMSVDDFRAFYPLAETAIANSLHADLVFEVDVRYDFTFRLLSNSSNTVILSLRFHPDGSWRYEDGMTEKLRKRMLAAFCWAPHPMREEEERVNIHPAPESSDLHRVKRVRKCAGTPRGTSVLSAVTELLDFIDYRLGCDIPLRVNQEVSPGRPYYALATLLKGRRFRRLKLEEWEIWCKTDDGLSAFLKNWHPFRGWARTSGKRDNMIPKPVYQGSHKICGDERYLIGPHSFMIFKRERSVARRIRGSLVSFSEWLQATVIPMHCISP